MRGWVQGLERCCDHRLGPAFLSALTPAPSGCHDTQASMGVMTPTTTQRAKRHDTLRSVPSKGTDRRTLRVEQELWDDFGIATASYKDGRSGVLRDFIRWFMDRPGAQLPPKPSLERPAATDEAESGA